MVHRHGPGKATADVRRPGWQIPESPCHVEIAPWAGHGEFLKLKDTTVHGIPELHVQRADRPCRWSRVGWPTGHLQVPGVSRAAHGHHRRLKRTGYGDGAAQRHLQQVEGGIDVRQPRQHPGFDLCKGKLGRKRSPLRQQPRREFQRHRTVSRQGSDTGPLERDPPVDSRHAELDVDDPNRRGGMEEIQRDRSVKHRDPGTGRESSQW